MGEYLSLLPFCYQLVHLSHQVGYAFFGFHVLANMRACVGSYYYLHALPSCAPAALWSF